MTDDDVLMLPFFFFYFTSPAVAYVHKILSNNGDTFFRLVVTFNSVRTIWVQFEIVGRRKYGKSRSRLASLLSASVAAWPGTLDDHVLSARSYKFRNAI